jgi:hypothetical protein
MTETEFVTHLINFLCEIGKYGDFEKYLESLGYTQDDMDDV